MFPCSIYKVPMLPMGVDNFIARMDACITFNKFISLNIWLKLSYCRCVFIYLQYIFWYLFIYKVLLPLGVDKFMTLLTSMHVDV